MNIIHCKECAIRHSPFFCPMANFTADGAYNVYEINEDDDFCSRGIRKGEAEENLEELVKQFEGKKMISEDDSITAQCTFEDFLNFIGDRR